MDFKHYLGDYYQTKSQNKTLKFAVTVIAIIVVINSVALIYSLNSHTTILVPPNFNTKSTISSNSASPGYLEMMARYIMNLEMNFTPDTADNQFSELLSYYSPSKYASAKVDLYNQLETIKTGKISQAFYIQDIKIMGNKIYVTGIVNRYSDVENIANNETHIYVIKYQIINGRFFILSISKKH
ncbi:MAG: type IV conjugative transfer system protein TraE [Thermoplasmata archaeon]